MTKDKKRKVLGMLSKLENRISTQRITVYVNTIPKRYKFQEDVQKIINEIKEIK
tara:strand:- start:292 stop:453 length:162 start_codon:yes stop_codon:yes gene_type:complete